MKQWLNYDTCCEAKQLLGKSIKISQKRDKWNCIQQKVQKESQYLRKFAFYVARPGHCNFSLPSWKKHPEVFEARVSCCLRAGIRAMHPSPVSVRGGRAREAQRWWGSQRLQLNRQQWWLRSWAWASRDSRSKVLSLTEVEAHCVQWCFSVLQSTRMCGAHSAWVSSQFPDKLLKSIRCLQWILWVECSRWRCSFQNPHFKKQFVWTNHYLIKNNMGTGFFWRAISRREHLALSPWGWRCQHLTH